MNYPRPDSSGSSRDLSLAQVLAGGARSPVRSTYDSTTEQVLSVRAGSTSRAGVVVLLAGGRPALRVVVYGDAPVVIGRGEGASLVLDDKRLSRMHVELSRDAQGWLVRDLGSRNGTRLDGQSLRAEERARGAILRVGDSILMLEDDVARFGRPCSVFGDVVQGPAITAIRDLMAEAARSGLRVLVQGETGVGKTLLARSFHESSLKASRPFGAIDCSAFSESALEATLFGCVRGSLNEKVGVFEACNEGTVLLAGIAEMPARLQSQLLQVLRRREVSRIGESRARPAHLQFVVSSKRPLRELVGAGSFRDDLFYELAQLVVDVPPLRSRREEIPFLVDATLRDARDLSIQPGFIEQCMNRPWHGNVRELVAAVRSAATAAKACGEQSIAAMHLPPVGKPPMVPAGRSEDSNDTSLRMTREEKELAVVAAYREQPDAAAIAVRFGIGVATVYRYLKRHDARRGGPDAS